MKKIFNKTITSLLILMLLLVSCPLTIIKSNAEETEVVDEVYDTLGEYLDVYYPNVSKSELTELRINQYNNIIIKDMSELNELVNLSRLELSMIECSDINVSNLENLKILDIRYLSSINGIDDNGYDMAEIIGINNLVNLVELAVMGVKCNEVLNFNNLKQLNVLELYNIRNNDTGPVKVANLTAPLNITKLKAEQISYEGTLDFSNNTNITEMTLNGISDNNYHVRSISTEELVIEKLVNIRKLTLDLELRGKLSFENNTSLKRLEIGGWYSHISDLVIDIRRNSRTIDFI